MIVPEGNILKRDRLLAIGPTPALGEYLRNRYPDCEVDRARSVLEGIDDLSRHDVRAVVAQIDPDDPRIEDALAGLRDAAGVRTKVLLCGQPGCEPRMRDIIGANAEAGAEARAGADDYLIWPLEGGELDRALGFVRGETAGVDSAGPAVSLEEIVLLNGLVAELDSERFTFLAKVADLVRMAMEAEAVTVIVDGSAASSGGTVANPVLTEPIQYQGRSIGRVTVGPRDRPYDAGDLTKLRHYADLAANLLTAARNQRQWRTEAMTDEVSGLYNRRYVLRFLGELLARARAERFRVTVLLFDIDNFKTYNDSYGHPAGDEVIRCIGQLFQAHCREHDVVARYGGDEYCVVFWDADQPRVAGSTHPADALSVLGRFRQALRSYHCAALSPDAKGTLTISGGLASYPWDASTVDELIQRADQALLRAKNAGKNQVFAFSENPDSKDPTAITN